MADSDCLKRLIHYAVDKGSPYALAQHSETDSYDKIAKLRLTQLAITDQGVAIMWSMINAYASNCGGKPVPATAASDVETVSDILDAVLKVSGT